MKGSLALPPRLALAAIGVGALAALSGLVLGPQGLAPAGAILAFSLAWAAFVDIDRMILPDELTIGLVIFGLGLGVLGVEPSLTTRIIGGVAGYLALASLETLYRHLRGREGLGRGDAKLAAAGGAWLGWSALPLICLIAALAGILFFLMKSTLSRRWLPHIALPFGPFLAAGIWILWLTGLPYN